MPQPEINIAHIAKLSRLNLTPEEAAQYEKQLAGIIGYIDQISSHPLEDVEPSAHAMPVFDVLRADEPRPGLSQEAALSNAPRQAMAQFQIPRVIEE